MHFLLSRSGFSAVGTSLATRLISALENYYILLKGQTMSKTFKKLKPEEKINLLIKYIRDKINQLHDVTGMSSIKDVKLTDEMLTEFDPIGIIAESFKQVLINLKDINLDLKLARDEIQAIFESVGVGLLVVNPDLKIVALNQKMKELFHIDTNDIEGKSCYEFTCKHYKERKYCTAREVFKKNKFIEIHNWRYGDKVFHVNGAPVKSPEGKPVRAVLSYYNISEQIKQEEEREKERELLKITLEGIHEGVISLDRNGEIILVNSAAERILQQKKEKIIGKQIEDLNFCKKLTAQNKQVFHPGPIKQFQPYQGSMCVSCRSDEREQMLEIYRIPVLLSKTMKSTTVLIIRDITENLVSEREMLNYEKLSSLSVLAGGIAHDFNNILTSVMSSISLARMNLDKRRESENYLDNADTALDQARKLIKQLSVFAKGGSPIKEVTSLRKLLPEIIQFSLSGTNIKHELSISDDLWLVNIDVAQFGQVINNMFLNSLQEMSEGGMIKLNADNYIKIPGDKRVPIPNGKYVKLSIEDTGSGIEEHNLKRIFDPFFSTRTGSIGIGLASAYSIVKRHYGHIDVKSKPGAGTIFTIYLPVTRSLSVKRKKKIKEEGKKRDKTRIMIVDDDEMILKSTGKLLKLMGYNVDTAINGEIGIKIMKENLENNIPYDLVILDLVIPGCMGGVEILKQLREIAPDIKAVVSSGYSDEEVLGNYSDYGFNGIVPKPYKSVELQAEINKVLSET